MENHQKDALRNLKSLLTIRSSEQKVEDFLLWMYTVNPFSFSDFLTETENKKDEDEEFANLLGKMNDEDCYLTIPESSDWDAEWMKIAAREAYRARYDDKISKIELIKQYRDASGKEVQYTGGQKVGLKEAKDAVEAWIKYDISKFDSWCWKYGLK